LRNLYAASNNQKYKLLLTRTLKLVFGGNKCMRQRLAVKILYQLKHLLKYTLECIIFNATPDQQRRKLCKTVHLIHLIGIEFQLWTNLTKKHHLTLWEI